MIAVQIEVAHRFQGLVEIGHFAPELRSISVTKVALTNCGAWRARCVQEEATCTESQFPDVHPICTCATADWIYEADGTCHCDPGSSTSCGVPPQPARVAVGFSRDLSLVHINLFNLLRDFIRTWQFSCAGALQGA